MNARLNLCDYYYLRMYHLPSLFPLYFPSISPLFSLSVQQRLVSLNCFGYTNQFVDGLFYCATSRPRRRCFCREHAKVDQVYDTRLVLCFWEPTITISSLSLSLSLSLAIGFGTIRRIEARRNWDWKEKSYSLSTLEKLSLTNQVRESVRILHSDIVHRILCEIF